MSHRSRYQIADSQQFQSVLTSSLEPNVSPQDPRTRAWDLLSYRAPEIDNDGRPCERFPWIQVSVHAQEVIRQNFAPTDTLPLDAQVIRNIGQRYSQLGARLILSDDTQDSRIVDVDIAGGFTFTWAGSGVAVKVLTQENGSPTRAVPESGLNGIVIADDIVGASATVGGVGNITGSGGGGALSPVCLKLTQSQNIPPGGAAFEVPSGACRVTLYALDDLTAEWIGYYQGPQSAPTVATGQFGIIPVPAIAIAKSVEVPGNVRALAVVNNGGINIVTAVWEISL